LAAVIDTSLTSERAPPAASVSDAAGVPLVVALEGTLLRANPLVEALVRLACSRPLEAAKIALSGWSGQKPLSQAVADRGLLDVDSLPLDADMLEHMRDEKARGRKVFLASHADKTIADAVAARLGFVDGVLAAQENSPGDGRREMLIRRFGEKGFDYVGSPNDGSVASAVRPGRPITAATIARALRLHQWVKNLLLFVPLVLGGMAGNYPIVLRVVLCFVAFGLLASTMYLVNDIVDVADDRRHHLNKDRPIASGDLPTGVAGWMILLGLALGLGTAAMLGWPLFFAFAGYAAMSLAYSVALKRIPILDVSTLAGFYAWRLVIGILAAHVEPSSWLLMFALAFFLSLSLAKRYTEIARIDAFAAAPVIGRGYRSGDSQFLMMLGVASGASSILIFVLYLIHGAFEAAYFTEPQALWICPPIFFLWLCRIWLLSGRGELHDDPVIFSLRDPVSLFLGALAAGAVLIALVA